MWYNQIGADVAQLVEQLIRNEQVTGSIPAIGSKSLLESPVWAFFLGVFVVEAMEKFLASVGSLDFLEPGLLWSLIFRGQYFYDVALF